MPTRKAAALVLVVLLLFLSILPAARVQAESDACIRFLDYLTTSKLNVNEPLPPSEWETILGLRVEAFELEYWPLTPLHGAVHLGCPEAVRLLLAQGADVQAGSPLLAPLYHSYLSIGLIQGQDDVEIARLLLQAGADPNRSITFGPEEYTTALHLAARPYPDIRPGYSTAAMTRLLLEYGADANARDYRGETPISDAVRFSQPETVELLLAAGAAVNAANTGGETPLAYAATREIAELLLRQGARPVSLHNAVHYGDWKVELMIEEGADVNEKDGEGRTPLHYVGIPEVNQLAIAGRLLAQGADVNARDNQGYTPLHATFFFADAGADILPVLLDAGADINARDHQGRTPLHLATEDWNLGKARVLIARGADVNVQDKAGMTPLYLAFAAGNKALAAELKAAGADESLIAPGHRFFELITRRPIGLGIFLGILAAGAIHWLSWRLRQARSDIALALGGISAILIYAIGLGFVANPGGAGEIAGAVQAFLAILLAVTALLGVYQARVMHWPYLRSILGLYIHAGAGIVLSLAGGSLASTVILGYRIDWRRVEAVKSSFLLTLILVILVLEVIRPLVVSRAANARKGE